MHSMHRVVLLVRTSIQNWKILNQSTQQNPQEYLS